MSAYARVCPWCGRTVVLTQLTRAATFAIVTAGALVLLTSVRGERVRRMAGLDDDPQTTAAELLARKQDPAWLTWLERVIGADRRDPAARAERILEGALLGETGALNIPSCQPRDTGRVLGWLARHPELSDGDVRQLACGIVPAGLTASQVKGIFGAPARVRRARDGDEEWIYSGSRVTLRDGRVVSVDR